MAKTAAHVDDICFIRSVYTDIPNHEPSMLMMNTGHSQVGRPSIGSWLTYGLGTENKNLPAYVVLCPDVPTTVGPPLWNNAFLPAIHQGTFISDKVIEKQTEATLDAEIAGLAEQYQQRGLSGLVQVIAERSAGERGDAMLYLITDPLSRPLAGNLSSWPNGELLRPGWLAFPVEVGRGATKRTDTARATTFAIPGGYRLLVGRDLSDANAFRKRVSETLAWAGVLTLGLGLVGGIVMSRNMLHRVEVVSNTAAEIIHGDLGKRVPLSGSGDEFDQLATNLNAMLDQIERLMAGMRQVTDNIAHDLRTPLARLRARLEVTLLEKPDATRYGEALRQTITEADTLLGTFNALLSIAEAFGVKFVEPPEIDLSGEFVYCLKGLWSVLVTGHVIRPSCSSPAHASASS